MVDINEVAENIYMIDDKLYSLPCLGSVYLLCERKKALVDTGPATSAGTVLDGIRKAGVRPEDIDYVIVTHIHLDHAGGAGFLIQGMPQAQAVVHHRGARHLIDPRKLVDSVIAVQGKEGMAKSGEVTAIAADRVRSVYDGDVIELGDKQVLRFIDAPGHAPHQLCVSESRNNGLFTGDAMGFHMANRLWMPSTAPPNFAREQYIHTLERLLKIGASKLYFAHFGPDHEARETLKLIISQFRSWESEMRKAIKENSLDVLEERMRDEVRTHLGPVRGMEGVVKHLVENSIPGNIAGYLKYYTESHKAS